MRYIGNPSYVFGFHGCDKSIAEKVLNGECDLTASTNDYDWLGHGIYFWEGNPTRAEQWAKERMAMPNSSIEEPAVVGAIIDLGFCFSLSQADHIEMLEQAFYTTEFAYSFSEEELPKNSGGSDRFLRRLDCEVIQTLHTEREYAEMTEFDSVRGIFQEGEPIYPDASFKKGNHIQICVRNRDCIKGYFRPINR